MKSWEKLAREIDAATKAAWAEEPLAIRRQRLGIIPSGAGSFNQYFSTMVFSLVYTLTMGEHVIYGLIKATDDPDVTLPSLKAMVRDHFVKGFEAPRFLGYVLEPNVHSFAERIVEALPEVKDNEAFRRLLGSYLTYLNILHWWLHIVFPWHLGASFPQVTKDRLRQLQQAMA